MDRQLAPALRRRLSLPLLVMYGTGVAVGAGIYVLVGAVAGHAGRYAPLSFLLAAVVMGLTVASYSELCTRFPVAAGEAAYVKAAFRSRLLSTATGLSMVMTAVVASATVALGASGYIAQFVDWPRPLVASVILIALGTVSGWGVLESVLLASVFTLIEVGGLVVIVGFAFAWGLPVVDTLTAVPPLDAATWSGIAYASLLAFFAFIGFEDLTNMVEEAKDPARTIPRAIAITLVITAVLYAVTAAVAVTALPPGQLAVSQAPLSDVFRKLAGVSPTTISLIAIVATLNTILAEMTMAARVIYGMAKLGDLPGIAGKVHPVTSTPLAATGAIVAVTVALVTFIPFERLAEVTSLATLVVFAMVNLSLLRLRRRRVVTDGPHIRIPLWVPAAGFVTCVGMIVAALLG
jgi:amino acid transporter